MANYTPNSLDHNDLNWELLNPFITMNNNPSLLPNLSTEYQTIMGFSSDPFLTKQTPQLQAKLSGHTPANSELVDPALSCVNGNSEYSGTATINKRKADDLADSSSLNSSSPMSSDGNTKRNNSGKGKRTRSNDKVGEKPNDVVHVRARRGQATDSHSIAERIRRGKINERLRCLQDIVPGCNKTMGMSVMLDEIINYVQSLQNQVEFLSMKLTAASQFHDFNSENEPLERIQKMKACNNSEAQDAEMIISQTRGYGQEPGNFFPPTWPF